MSLRFASTNGVVNRSGAANLGNTQSGTFLFWYRKEDSTQDRDIGYLTRSGGGTAVRIGTAGQIYGGWTTGPLTGTNVATNAWVGIALVRTDSVSEFYVYNGTSTTLVVSDDQSFSEADINNIYLGDTGAHSDSAVGCYRYARYWTAVLTTTEMTAEFQMTPSSGTPAARATNLYFSWPLANATDTTDWTGNSRVPTISNGSTSSDEPTITSPIVLTADVGTFSYTGQAAMQHLTMASATGTFTYTGQNAGQRLTMASATGSFSYTGIDAALTYDPVGGYILTSDVGTFAISGQAAGKLMTMAAATGTFVYQGSPAVLDLVLTSEVGTFSLAGQDANLTYAPVGGGTNYTLTADQGSSSISGQAAELARGLKLISDLGTYSIAGQENAWRRTYTLNMQNGSFILQGFRVVGGAAPDTSSDASGPFKIRKVLIVSESGRTKWVNYIPVKQIDADGENIGRFQNVGGVEVELLGSGTGLTEWVDYIPVVEVNDSDTYRWRYDNAGFIPIIIVE
jgi:hypothetical protein